MAGVHETAMEGETDQRTIEHVQAIATQAKLDPTDLAPISQCLYFAEELNPEEMALLQVEDGMLEHLMEGSSLIVRGDKQENAILCTNDRTFDMKKQQTSNTLLLLPECQTVADMKDADQSLYDRQVVGYVHSYYELRRMRPKLQKLHILLDDRAYKGAMYEADHDEDDEDEPKLYTLADLKSRIQASEEEIMAELKKIKACCINSYWRVLEYNYENQVLSHIVNLVEENSWNYKEIPLNETLEVLQSLEPRIILEHCLNCHGEKFEKDDVIYYALDEDKVCRSFAELLLRPADKFNFSEFLQSWQMSVPETMTTGLHQLQGMALIDKTSRPEVIWYFPVSALPEDEKDRFDTLFRTREKWTKDDIEPYIQDLVTAKTSAGALLTKHTRSSMGPNGVKLYNSKRPVR
ncbi:sister chromatid cohesion protein DCC1-like isoform X2 [Amphiura filiformis]|uniref:sister chromatid cohesion protein DCC1-like isoform X2 n=2 Tax=Amphiura filiformis TaxID=82378 RepID=UPI003B2156B8